MKSTLTKIAAPVSLMISAMGLSGAAQAASADASDQAFEENRMAIEGCLKILLAKPQKVSEFDVPPDMDPNYQRHVGERFAIELTSGVKCQLTTIRLPESGRLDGFTLWGRNGPEGAPTMGLYYQFTYPEDGGPPKVMQSYEGYLTGKGRVYKVDVNGKVMGNGKDDPRLAQMLENRYSLDFERQQIHITGTGKDFLDKYYQQVPLKPPPVIYIPQFRPKR